MENFLKVPVFDSYIQIPKDAIEECVYLNTEIVQRLKEKMKLMGRYPNLAMVIDASNNPEKYGLNDKFDKPLKGREIKYWAVMRYNNDSHNITFDRELFLSWYHTFHKDGIERKKFFLSLGQDQREQLNYFDIIP